MRTDTYSPSPMLRGIAMCLLAIALIIMASLTGAPRASATSLITNGDFESNSLTGGTVSNPFGIGGNWQTYSGPNGPVSSLFTLSPTPVTYDRSAFAGQTVHLRFTSVATAPDLLPAKKQSMPVLFRGAAGGEAKP